MARPRKPWYRSGRHDWLVTVDGKQVPLGPHPADAGPPRRGKPKPGQRDGDWVIPPAILKEYHRRMAERDDPEASGAAHGTVAALFAKFLGWTKAHKAEATYLQRRHFLRSFVRHRNVRDLPPHRVTAELVEGWLAAHPNWTGGRRHAVLIVLRAFTWAVKRKLLSRNPVTGVEVPPQRRVLHYLTKDQRRAIHGAVRDRAFRTFLTALEQTGCRPGELCAVEAAEADPDAGVWVIPNHKTARKTGRPRTVYLTEAMSGLTRELAAENPDGPLFRNSRGQPWNRNAVRCRFRHLRKKFPGFGPFTATSFRRAFVTDALERGVDAVKVAELVGHTSTDMIMAHYAQLQERVRHMREMAGKAAG
ncbi:MAG: site-specific integrase [Gemmataceae bacterium]|nr:site-specific integrase [Gemmataceae bacterium]